MSLLSIAHEIRKTNDPSVVCPSHVLYLELTFTFRGSSTRVGLELELTSCTSLTYANTVVKIKIKHRNIRKDWLASGSHNEGQKNKTQKKKSIPLVGQFQFHTSEWEHNFLNKNRGPPVQGFMFYFCFLFFPSWMLFLSVFATYLKQLWDFSLQFDRSILDILHPMSP